MNPSLLIAQAAETQTGILDRIDSSALSALSIITVIGAFALAIVVVGCISTTIQRVVAIRESNRLILELLNRGYSPEDIERVAYGKSKFSKKVGRFFRNARNTFRKEENQKAIPPAKTVEHRASA